MNENFDINNQEVAEEAEVNVPIRSVTREPYGLNEESFKERREIRLISRLASLSFITLLVVSYVLATVLFYALLIFGFSYDKASGLLSDPYFQQFFQIAASSLMFIVPFAFFFKCGGYKISKIINFNLPKAKNWFPIVLMGVGFCSFANMAVTIAGSFFERFGINYDVDFGENPTGTFGIILTVISTAVIPPLGEEFACRGILLGSLRKFGDGFAIMVSSILFGAIHGNFQQAPFAFLIGLIMGFITVKCNSIWPAILIHAYNNLVSVVCDYLFVDLLVNMQNIIYTFYLVICLLIGIVGLVFLKNDTDTFKLTPANTSATTKQKYKWVFTTELVIITLIMCFIGALRYFVM